MPGRMCLLAAIAVSTAACGVPQDVAKQAEQVASIAAEGSLLARDVRQGDTTGTFVRVHADALQEKLAPLADAVEQEQLASVVKTVEEQLAALERWPGDSSRAAGIEQRLDDAAKRAEEIGKAAA
jgi:paraquat-inducible protein B